MQRFLATLLALTGILTVGVTAQSLSPKEWARTLKHDVQVLMVALQPGDEDIPALVHLRERYRARITCAYLTNGEAGEHGLKLLYPPYLAAERREEATRALAVIGAEPLFLNFPDVPAAADTIRLRLRWDADSVQQRLARVIADVRPDLVLLAPDPEWGDDSPRSAVIASDILTAITRASAPPVSGDGENSRSWEVVRFARASRSGTCTFSPLGETSRLNSLVHAMISAYQSRPTLGRLWMDARPYKYVILFPLASSSISVDKDIPVPVSQRFRNLQSSINALADAVLRDRKNVRLQAKPLPLLTAVVALLDSVDAFIAQSHILTSRERRTAMHWKGTLENLRSALLGIRVDVTTDFTSVTELQVIHLTIDSLHGAIGKGVTELYFPMIDQGWVVNEELNKRVPLILGEPYRLLSPRSLTFTHPAALYGLERTRTDVPQVILVIHRAAVRESSFVHRIQLSLKYTPRFTTEILTPIILLRNGEQVHVRLVNNSRDGVADVIVANSEWVTSTTGIFRLPEKGAVYEESLRLTWRDGLEDGDYLIPVSIDGIEVGGFLARKFNIAVDSSVKVGIISSMTRSPLHVSLERLGVTPKPVNLDRGGSITGVDILFLDRRALTLVPEASEWKTPLQDFARRGGHLIILAQDAEAWNHLGVWPGLHLAADFTLDQYITITADSALWARYSPNRITDVTFEDWLFRTGYNRLYGPVVESADKFVTVDGRGNPLMVSAIYGAGRMTYVDLALHPQLLNIHEGAFQVLANLVSWRGGHE